MSQIIFAQNDTLKIHPVGDSITRGKEGDTYRNYLKAKLKDEANITINFVGQCPHAADVGATWEESQELYNKLEGDIEHDGYGGLRIDQITDMTYNTRGYPKITIEEMVTDSPADVILLMIGTNDIISQYELETAGARLDTLIRKILSVAEGHLIVSTIPPTPLPISNGRIEAFNSIIPAIVDSYKTLGSNISFVDINSYMDGSTDLLDDAYHPNSLGFEHIADGWYDAITGTVTEVEEEKKNKETPAGFELKQNYPNPFNPSTVINYSIPQLSKVKLEIFDVLGQKLKTLVDREQDSGNYQVIFDATNYPSGIYFSRITAGKFSKTKQMLLLK
jgi:hypothetical protein